MNRLILISFAAAGLAMGAAACGPGEESAVQTLPPIRTTTTTSTTPETVNTNRIFYTVKAGENLNLIAKSFEVPLQELIKLNRRVLPDPDNVAVGVSLEIPTGIQQVSELPTTTSTTDP